MLIEHALGRSGLLARIITWWLLVFPRWGQTFPRSLRCIGMQRSQPTLTSHVVQGQAVGAIGEMILPLPDSSE